MLPLIKIYFNLLKIKFWLQNITRLKIEKSNLFDTSNFVASTGEFIEEISRRMRE